MAIYRGRRGRFQNEVTVDGEPLDPRFDILNHSPTGFEWGYGGSGPSQLSLAILAHATDDETAERYYHTFLVVIGKLPDTWEINTKQIEDWLDLFQAHELSIMDVDLFDL